MQVDRYDNVGESVWSSREHALESHAARSQWRPQNQEHVQTTETCTADIDSRMQSAFTEMIQTSRQASLEIAASVAEMMRTSPRKSVCSEQSGRSSTASSSSSRTARVIARGPGRLPRLVPGDYEDEKATGMTDALHQCVDIVTEDEMLNRQCVAQKAVEQHECSSSHNSIVLLSSPSSANSSIV